MYFNTKGCSNMQRFPNVVGRLPGGCLGMSEGVKRKGQGSQEEKKEKSTDPARKIALRGTVGVCFF